MDILQKAGILGRAGQYDSCGPKMCEVNISKGLGGIYNAKAEHKTCRIFKTLMDNNCSYDCKYCANANSCKKEKARYEPKELKNLFSYLNRKMGVNGLFLSSAVSKNPDKVMEEMIDSIELIRKDFTGYIHLKVLPGASYDTIKHASVYVDRMSVNIESPTKDILSGLSSCKDYKTDLLRRQAWIKKMGITSGQTTQMIVDGVSTDKEIIRMASWEYDNLDMRRVYYSAFKPVKGTPLETHAAQPEKRENHLYNADFLIREYGYKKQEIYSIMDDGMLPDEDPKLALAKMNDLCIDINEAGYEELIRIPGIGPATARKISSKKRYISSYQELDVFGARLEKAKPFITIKGCIQRRLDDWR
ncbi:MAG: radical SAM protein [Candidatus Woesearchaeota archaeon]|nr:radical SAM protein [Candidatus Woesearchaeota archaeon]